MLLERAESGDHVVYYVSPALRAAGVPHAFSTRVGGVSAAPFDSLNLGNPSGTAAQDDPENIQENYRRLQRAIGCGGRGRRFVHQVHGADVVRAEAGRPFDCAAMADAIITADAGCVLAVRVADCVPVLLADERGRAVAAVHAGWRGVAAGVVPAAVERMARDADVPASRLAAAVGPCIGADAFEVGPEVLRTFAGLFGRDAHVRHGRDGKGFVNLRHLVRLQLLAAGVREGRIDVSDRCTARDAGEFFSHRRCGGATGRMAALIGPAAGGA